MNFIRRMSLVWVTIALAAVSAGAQDARGSKDHPMITRYPGSYIRDYVQKPYDEFTLPLGRADEGKFTKSQHLEGKTTRIRYDCPPGRSVLEVFRNYEGALKKAGFVTLFTCGPEQCGAGGGTMYAGVGELPWTPDHGIRYLSAKLARPEGEVYVSLLVDDEGFMKGPDGNYGPAAQLYVIEMKPMEAGLITVDAASLANDINRTGHASVYGIYFDTGKADVKPESDATLKEIAKLLHGNPGLKLYVVGHTDNQGTLDLNMDLSRRRAQAVLTALTTKHGVPTGSLRAYGSGPYAPVASNDSEDGRAKNRRVELVKQ